MLGILLLFRGYKVRIGESFLFFPRSIIVTDNSLAYNIILIFWIILTFAFLGIKRCILFKEAWLIIVRFRLMSLVMIFILFIEKPSHLEQFKKVKIIIESYNFPQLYNLFPDF